MKRTLWIVSGIALATALAVAAASAQTGSPNAGDPPAMGMGMGPGMHSGRMMVMRRGMNGGEWGHGRAGEMMMRRLRMLDLSADQWTKVRDIHENCQIAVIPKQADVQVKQIQLRQLMQADQPNLKQIDAKIDDIADVRADIQKLRAHAMLDIRNVLTPEQRQKLMTDGWGGHRGWKADSTRVGNMHPKTRGGKW